MAYFEIEVKVTYTEPLQSNIRPIVSLTYLRKTDDEELAKSSALMMAKEKQKKHPRKYKGANFSIENCVYHQ